MKEQKDPTRDPLPPPFAVGARIRYVGNRLVTTGLDPRDSRVLLGPGMEVEIVECVEGSRGTGRVEYVDDDGEDVIDSTRDGRSIYIVFDGHKHRRRSIDPQSARDWREVQP